MCDHEQFAAEVTIGRVKNDAGNVVGHLFTATVRCSQCDKSFAFMGLPGGLSPNVPTMSMDGITINMPISESDGETRVRTSVHEQFGKSRLVS